ncbi:MAG: bifunctional glycosyltransferase family 2/GtrA family protein [Oscillospiraceae bacterium]|nr:bifunctional glycosyltransferase family 2/GtrA family protein [Oscillospiraceae bacterium]
MSQSTAVVLIPAYKPDERLIALCRALRDQNLTVLVVDDGSGEKFAPVFEQVSVLGCALERHAVNLGKGRALKTGINTALNRFPGLSGVVTADADGQHTPEDILRVIAAMEAHPHALVLGARAFTGKVPLKSRWGNGITRQVYRFVSGIRCRDTQTGLRGIPAAALPDMLRLPGERYEYEMTMLLHLRDLKMPLEEVPIDTIYLDNNKGSHFHPFRDALRIYAVIAKFLLSSLLSFALNYALYLLALAMGFAPWVCYVTARLLSSGFNYGMNRMAVFGGRGGRGSLLRYYLLAMVQMAVGAALVQLLSGIAGIDAVWIILPVDTLLFFISYLIQRDFVFK